MGKGPGCFKRALVVEDDAPLRRAVARVLRSWKVECVQASTVADARAELEHPFDLVVTDVRLPDGTGLEVAAAANEQTVSPLMVAMSGVASAGEAFQLAQHGVHVYLSKPFSPEELERKIEQALELPQYADRLPSSVWSVPIPESSQLQLATNLEGFAERYRLTPRQLDLVRLTVSGIPRRRYPELLGVTDNTCKTLIRRLLHKCGARTLADIPRLMLVEAGEGR